MSTTLPRTDTIGAEPRGRVLIGHGRLNRPFGSTSTPSMRGLRPLSLCGMVHNGTSVTPSSSLFTFPRLAAAHGEYQRHGVANLCVTAN
jgi:hypothetical protein